MFTYNQRLLASSISMILSGGRICLALSSLPPLSFIFLHIRYISFFLETVDINSPPLFSIDSFNILSLIPVNKNDNPESLPCFGNSILHIPPILFIKLIKLSIFCNIKSAVFSPTSSTLIKSSRLKFFSINS
ncbi:MAG: hypothetical protein [Caudoviricetes sp.]|nr:MAG: hypothetical protein [Caudoviricetes sp.]